MDGECEDVCESNVAILKRAYGAWHDNKEQAFDIWVNLLADDVCLKSLADGRPGMEFSACCHSKEEVLQFLQGLANDWEMIEYQMDEYIAEGDKVVAVGYCHWRYRETGREVRTPKVDIVTLKAGKIARFEELYNTASALACTQCEPSAQTQ